MKRGEQFQRNLKHAADFLDAVIDEPDKLASIPDGASVVFMPDDDPELRAVNAQLITGSSVIVTTDQRGRALEGIEIDPTARIVQCRSCGSAVWWGTSRAGRPTPFNVIGLERTAISHFTSCPDAGRWSKR